MNINEIFNSTGGVFTPRGIKVLFDGIEEEVCDQIADCEVVVGCGYKLTNSNIITALMDKKATCIVLDKKSVLEKRKFYENLNSKLTAYAFSPSRIDSPYFFVPLKFKDKEQKNDHSIRMFGLSVKPYEDEFTGEYGSQKAKRHPLFHHKFLVFCRLDEFGHVWANSVLTGSYNFTENANYSRENAILIEDKNIATGFLSEWQRCVVLSESFNHFCEDDISPEFISEGSFSHLKEANTLNDERTEKAIDEAYWRELGPDY